MSGTKRSAAAPAHGGGIGAAVASDQRRFIARLQLNQYLVQLRNAIETGELDGKKILDDLINELLRLEFPDQDLARAANDIVQLAFQRKERTKAQ